MNERENILLFSGFRFKGKSWVFKKYYFYLFVLFNLEKKTKI